MIERLAVLMPAYNEGERLVATLRELRSAAVESKKHHVTVFVVDDGSVSPIDLADLSSSSRSSSSSSSEHFRIVLARHPVNLGQGAAIETARRLALEPRFRHDGKDFKVWVTMDSDGQHRAEDAFALASAIVDGGADVALGDRFAGASEVPQSRRIVLWLARVFERMTTGLVLSDAHNGLRAFSPRAIVQMRLRQNRMAHATELTRRISTVVVTHEHDEPQPLRLVEVPVSVRYTDATLAKGQRASGAVTILMDLFYAFLFGETKQS